MKAFWSILREVKKYTRNYMKILKNSLFIETEKHFSNDKLPVIIGIKPGLVEIFIDEVSSLVDCTVTAHKNIVLPFL